VALADDHIAVLQRVSTLLATEFEIVAAVEDGANAVQAGLDFRPDIFILDICMPGLSGIQAAGEMRRLGLSSKLVFLTIQEDADYLEAAQALGASYVLKSRMHSDLPLAVREALAGRIFVSRLSTPSSLAPVSDR
jgi:DNA-binding NarL/FixJ family response regulator